MLGRWPTPARSSCGRRPAIDSDVGEGIETDARRGDAPAIPRRADAPAWSAVSTGGLGKLPPIPGVERLMILVDHDLNGAGQAAAARCAERWSRAGRSAIG